MDLESHLEILRRQEQRRHKFVPAQSDRQKTRNQNERQYRMEQAVAGLLQVILDYFSLSGSRESLNSCEGPYKAENLATHRSI